jgi:hypothetical protein
MEGAALWFKICEEARIYSNHYYGVPYGILVDGHLTGTIALNTWRNNHNGAGIALLTGRNFGGSTGTTRLNIIGNTMVGNPRPNSQLGILLQGYGNAYLNCIGNTYDVLDAAYYDAYQETNPWVVKSIGEDFGDVTKIIDYGYGYQSNTLYKGDIYPLYGLTADRPLLSPGNAGYDFYDTTLNKKIMWNGSAWINLDGTPLV